MNLYQRVLGNPFVYNHVRPLAVGGLDLSPFYRGLSTGADSVIVDVGCGTGDALRYVDRFSEYVGLDTDAIAIGFAKKRYEQQRNVSFECRELVADDVKRIAPTHVIMAGLLHHLSDDDALALLSSIRESPRLEQVVTLDIVFLPGKWVSNLLAGMDRGKFCRDSSGYAALAERAGFDVADSRLLRSHPVTGLAWYFIMTLALRGRQR
jgi:SAM-dependent methyltransferase